MNVANKYMLDLPGIALSDGTVDFRIFFAGITD
jgi:hypothetical protein